MTAPAPERTAPPPALWARFIFYPVGWLLARSPDAIKSLVCHLLGYAIFYGMPRRRRTLLSNLHHIFPEWDEEKLWRVGKRSSASMIELGAYTFMIPFLTRRWIQSRVILAPGVKETLKAMKNQEVGTVIAVPHVALAEVGTLLPALAETPAGGGIYRPLNQKTFDDFLVWSRNTFGYVAYSRRSGLARAIKGVRQGHFLGVLFDQNSGPNGVAALDMGRVCYATEMLAMVCRKYGSPLYGLYPRRIRGWQVEVHFEKIDIPDDIGGIIQATHDWFDAKVRRSEQECADWLWMHNRWKFNPEPRKQLGLDARQSYLPEGPLPRMYRIWLRLPDRFDSDDAVLAFIAALRASRRDAHITLIASATVLERSLLADAADAAVAQPDPNENRQTYFQALAFQYPDCYLSLQPDGSADLEGVWIGAPHRLGWALPGAPRPQLTATCPVEDRASWEAMDELERWLRLAAYFGLQHALP